MGVDGRCQGGEHRGQHQPLDPGRQHLGHAADVGHLPLGGLDGERRRRRRIGREQDQQPQPQRQPQEAAQQDLGEGEHHRRLLGVPVRAAGHGALGEIAGAVGVELHQPLQREHAEQRQAHVPGVPRIEGEDLRGRDPVDGPPLGEQRGDLPGQGREAAGVVDDDPGEHQGPDDHQGELHDVGVDDAAQAPGGRIERGHRDDRQDRQEVVGGEHPELGARRIDGERHPHPGDEVHHRREHPGGKPLVPEQERLGDGLGREQHPGEDGAVEQGAEIERLEGAQHRRRPAAVAQLGQLGVGQHRSAPPARRQQEPQHQEGQGIDPQPPQREDAGDGDQPGDQQRRVRRELGGGHADPSLPAGQRPPGEKVFLQVPARLLPRPEPGGHRPYNKGDDDGDIDGRKHGAPSGR